MHQRFATALAVSFFVSAVRAEAVDLPTAQQTPGRGQSTASVTSQLEVPLVFEENRGQSDAAVKYLMRGKGYRAFFAANEFVIALSASGTSQQTGSHTQSAQVYMRLLDANRDTQLSGELPLPGKSNYFLGADPNRHVTDVPQFARVRYTAVYPGIDLIVYGNRGAMEYDFVVSPGADARRIRLRFDGAGTVSIDEHGNLILATTLGEIKQLAPRLYQELCTKQETVSGRFIRLSEKDYGFQVDSYDPSRPLIIDPVLSYSTFLGGGSDDFGTAIAVDAAGNSYVTGYASSANFPLQGQYDGVLGSGDTDVFVAKLNANGSGLIYSTFIGGSNVDRGVGVAVDNAGNAYVTGTTSGSGFPTTTNAYQRGVSAGGSFVAKLGPSGNALLYSTYVQKATTAAIAVDSNGNAYVTGSATNGFSTSAGAFQTSYRSPGPNAFVLKLNGNGTGATYSTFLSGGNDVGNGIAVDANFNAYVGGATSSTTFPVANAYQTTLSGQQDGFVARLNASGSALVFSTFLGGFRNDSVNAIAIDQSGNVYAGGETYSDNFPYTRGAFLTQRPSFVSNSIVGTGFVSKLVPTGNALIYSTYLGGDLCSSPCTLGSLPAQSPGDAVYGVAVDNQGQAAVTGIVRSYTFPLVDTLRPAQPTSQDALFVTKLAARGTQLVYSTLVRTGVTHSGNTPSGQPFDAGKGIAVDASGNAYVASEGYADFPTTAGAFRTTNAGGADAMVFKLANGAVTVTLNSSLNPAVVGQSSTLTATVVGANPGGLVTFWQDGVTNLGTVTVTNGIATKTIFNPSAGVTSITATYRDGSNEGAATLYQVANPPAVCN